MQRTAPLNGIILLAVFAVLPGARTPWAAERVTPGITVQSAAYASPRNGASLDITVLARTRCGPGSRDCSLTCSNSLAGDPDFGQRKNCRIDYRCDDGPARAVTVQEGEIARLSCSVDEVVQRTPPANLEAAAMECSSHKYNIWNAEQRGTPHTRDERIAKLIEFGNECRRPLGLPDMVNNVPPEPKPVLSRPAGAEAAATLQDLVKSNSIDKLRKYLATAGTDINARPGTDESLLDYAAEQNRPEIARYLIAHGARVEAMQWEGRGRGLTALHRAAAADAAEIAELLIAHGAAVNAMGPLGVTPLILAASQDSLRTATVLLQHGANITVATGKRETALSEAAVRGHQDMVRLLLIHAPVPSQDSFAQAAIRGDLETFRIALSHDALVHDVPVESKDLSLRFAILGTDEHTQERLRIIELLLEHGANINNRINNAPNTPIMLTTSPAVLELLLAHGADVRPGNDPDELIQALACNRNSRDPIALFNVLIAHDIAINNPPNRGLTVLQCAVVTHRPDFETFLLTHGVPVDIRDARGRTAIFEAADMETIQPLLQHGADLNAVDQQNQTPLSSARAEGRPAQVALLQSLITRTPSGR